MCIRAASRSEKWLLRLKILGNQKILEKKLKLYGVKTYSIVFPFYKEKIGNSSQKLRKSTYK